MTKRPLKIQLTTTDPPYIKLLAILDEFTLGRSKRDLTSLGRRLGAIAGVPAFSYKYLHSVLRGSLAAGKKLDRAMDALLAAADGANAAIAEGETYQVMSYSQEDLDHAFILGKAQRCPRCLLKFVSNHPRRKYCHICSPPRK